MTFRKWSLSLTCALALASGSVQAETKAGPPVKKPAKEIVALGSLKSPTVEVARGQALEWLKGVGKTDEATTKAFEAIWAQKDGQVLDMVEKTLVLGDATAAKLMKEARDPNSSAPVEVPPVILDGKLPVFYRANLGLSYAKALSGRRVFEESLEVLSKLKADQVVDPGAFFFHKAVAEHALLLKDEASKSIFAILEDVGDAPDRYKMVALLMLHDMGDWNDKDLNFIARKMDNIERRLELARGGPKTQKMQREVVARLDEIIKKLEQQKKGGGGGGGGGSCPGKDPSAGPPKGSGGAQGGSPMQDSNIGGGSGKGDVDPKKLAGLAKEWGKLPEKERARAMAELTRDMPPRYREVIENYFKKLAKNGGN